MLPSGLLTICLAHSRPLPRSSVVQHGVGGLAGLVRAKLLGSLVGGSIAFILLLRDGTLAFDHPLFLAVLAVLCLPALNLWAWVLFGSGTNAWRASRWLFIRDSHSLMQSDYIEDKFAEVRLGVMLVLYLVTVAAFYTGVLTIYDRFFAASP